MQFFKTELVSVRVEIKKKIAISRGWQLKSQLCRVLTHKRTRYHLSSSLKKCFHCVGKVNTKYLFFELVGYSALSWNKGQHHGW